MPPSNLSLKQRLAALSIAPSAPSSPISSDSHFRSPISPRRKTFFTPPWTKRNGESGVNVEQEGRELVQEVMSRVIFQAGVDYETRPMVVINASALPDPREVNYDLLLSRILSYLNLYVESDYTVVFFAAGGKHTPGWSWVWKAHRSLSRKYRKNLKRLFIVHSSFFSKMLFSLAGAIISPKFFRKISYIDSLSELAYHVPLTQIDIAPAVYQENLKHEKKIVLPIPAPSSVFGVPLEDIMGYEGEKGGIPRVVKDAIQFLRETGLQEEGLFRRSPPSAMLRAAQEAYDRGNVVSLDTFGDPHLAAVLLKKYLRDLPTPVFPEMLYPVIRRCPMPSSDLTDMTSVMYIREVLLPELPPCVYILLSHVLHLMHEVSLRSASNRMDAHNLAVVLCPNLVSGTNPARDVLMCAVPGGPAIFESNVPPAPSSLNKAALSENKTTLGAIVKLCIQRYYEVFDEVVDRSEALLPVGHVEREFVEGGSGSGSGSGSPSASASGGVSEDENKPVGGGSNGFKFNEFVGGAHQHHRRQSSTGGAHDDDEDIDDAMLVMPIGPSHGHTFSGTTIQPNGNDGPPSAWGSSGGVTASTSTPTPISNSTYRPRHRTGLSTSSSTSRGVRSLHNIASGAGSGTPDNSSSHFAPSSFAYPTFNKSKAKSTISIERGSIGGAAGGGGGGGGGALGTTGRKGSISIGRGTMRKSAGAGVEAMGITAEGFFAPPMNGTVPPVPPLPVSGSLEAKGGGGGGMT